MHLELIPENELLLEIPKLYYQASYVQKHQQGLFFARLLDACGEGLVSLWLEKQKRVKCDKRQ